MTNSWRFKVLVGTACLLVGLAITYACSDFLDTPAQGALEEAALITKAGVEGALIAAYRSLDCNNATNGNWGCAASNWPFASITSDDAYKGAEATDQPQATKLELYAWSSDQAQDYLDRKWASMYEGVARANATIRFLEKVSQAKPGAISHADSIGILGEALFLRAHYHFELWRMWGNVPYYFATDSDYRKPNDTDAARGADSVVKLVLAEGGGAAALLPATPRNGEKGRVTSWTARAYKGRVLAYTHQYAAAIATWYGQSSANLLTPHLPREETGGGLIGAWRYVRQTWDPWLASSLAWTNDEGKGPQSSVAADDDPLRLTMYAGLTWLCGGAGFVLHTGAGVGGGDAASKERGRVANLWEVANIEQTLAGIQTVRGLLPADLPNWSRHNANSSFPGYPFDTDRLVPLIEGGQMLRAFAATGGGRLIVMPIVAQVAVPFTARSAMHLEIYDPITGEPRGVCDLAANETCTLPPTLAAVMIGSVR